MANGWYQEGLKQFALGNVLWKAAAGSTIKACLVDTASYTVNLATHANFSDVTVGARVGTPVALTLVDAAAGGVLDANDISFTGLSSAPTIEALVIYKDTGTESTSTLLAYIDTATGLPTPAGATQVDVAWSNGAGKIAQL